jgi:hypothetical protein
MKAMLSWACRHAPIGIGISAGCAACWPSRPPVQLQALLNGAGGDNFRVKDW